MANALPRERKRGMLPLTLTGHKYATCCASLLLLKIASPYKERRLGVDWVLFCHIWIISMNNVGTKKTMNSWSGCQNSITTIQIAIIITGDPTKCSNLPAYQRTSGLSCFWNAFPLPQKGLTSFNTLGTHD